MATVNLSVLKARIKNGDLKYYSTAKGRKGEKAVKLYFWGSTMPDVVVNPEYQEALLPFLEEYDRKRMTPPAEFADCNGYVSEAGGCKILKEMFCVTRGKCKFYNQKEKEWK